MGRKLVIDGQPRPHPKGCGVPAILMLRVRLRPNSEW